jgi:hypothetical protein
MGDGGAMGEEFWMQWRAWALAMSWLGSRRGSALPSVSHDEHHPRRRRVGGLPAPAHRDGCNYNVPWTAALLRLQ